MSRSQCFVVLLLSVASIAATAQQPAPLMEKIDVSLVNVDVTVTSRGEAVRGLTREDFEVLEDGVPQPITNFYAIAGRQAQAQATAPAAQRAASIETADDRFRRRVLLLIDNTHLSR